MDITNKQIEIAAKKYPRAVTGAMAGCEYPADVLRWVLANTKGDCRRFAVNFILTGHGACWNAMANCLPADGWLVWYAGIAGGQQARRKYMSAIGREGGQRTSAAKRDAARANAKRPRPGARGPRKSRGKNKTENP